MCLGGQQKKDLGTTKKTGNTERGQKVHGNKIITHTKNKKATDKTDEISDLRSTRSPKAEIP